jgi:DNA-binding PadR family transcriptional regulator
VPRVPNRRRAPLTSLAPALDQLLRLTYYYVERNRNDMAKTSAPGDDFGRFSEPALLILISLAGEPRHGYGMIDDIAAMTGTRLGAGTLYGAIARLEAAGMIEPLPSEERRNPYRLTALGARHLRARLASLQAVARIGQRRLAGA